MVNTTGCWLAGTSTGVLVCFTRNATNLPVSVWLAFRLTLWTSSAPSSRRDTLVDGRPSSITPTVGGFSALEQRLGAWQPRRRRGRKQCDHAAEKVRRPRRSV